MIPKWGEDFNFEVTWKEIVGVAREGVEPKLTEQCDTVAGIDKLGRLLCELHNMPNVVEKTISVRAFVNHEQALLEIGKLGSLYIEALKNPGDGIDVYLLLLLQQAMIEGLLQQIRDERKDSKLPTSLKEVPAPLREALSEWSFDHIRCDLTQTLAKLG